MNEALAGFNVVAQSNEDGSIYVVPAGTNANLTDIQAAAIGSTNLAVAGLDVTISVDKNPSMAAGSNFAGYAVDEAGNISTISSTAFSVDYTDTDSITINGSSVAASVSTPGGKHVFSVDLTSGQQYTFETNNGTNDPTLRLYKHDGLKFIEVTYDDDSSSNGSLDAKIVFSADQTTTYYIMVEEYNSSGTGTCDLTLTTP